MIKDVLAQGIYLARFDDVRDFVQPHIVRIGEEAGRTGLFEDIRSACRESRAFLFTSSKIEGFFVLRPMPNNIMQIWVAFCTEPESVKKYQSVIVGMCRDLGVQQLEFETALPAMERFMPRFGWKKAYTVWRQNI